MRHKFDIARKTFDFKFLAGTSRGVLKQKESFFIRITDTVSGWAGIGEAGPLSGLSSEFGRDLRSEFLSAVNKIQEGEMLLAEKIREDYSISSSVKFAIETALLDLSTKDEFCIFKNHFYSGIKSIPINGLVWMGDMEFMRNQMDKKLSEGFTCIKIKIGALNFDDEVSLIKAIRQEYGPEKITIRVDANGAYDFDQAMRYMDILYNLDVHSIEQPIKAGQFELMSIISRESPLPIALDEELIGLRKPEEKQQMLDQIKPSFIVLKPSLHGGLSETQNWINLSEERGIKWWITSALESNVGLNTIAQFTANYKNNLHQGLGTGQLYHNNIESPLEIKEGYISYNTALKWNAGLLDFKPL